VAEGVLPGVFAPQKYPVDFPTTGCHEAGFCLDISGLRSYEFSMNSDILPPGFKGNGSDGVHFQSTWWGDASGSDKQQAIMNAQAQAAQGNIPNCSSAIP